MKAVMPSEKSDLGARAKGTRKKDIPQRFLVPPIHPKRDEAITFTDFLNIKANYRKKFLHQINKIEFSKAIYTKLINFAQDILFR